MLVMNSLNNGRGVSISGSMEDTKDCPIEHSGPAPSSTTIEPSSSEMGGSDSASSVQQSQPGPVLVTPNEPVDESNPEIAPEDGIVRAAEAEPKAEMVDGISLNFDCDSNVFGSPSVSIVVNDCGYRVRFRVYLSVALRLLHSPEWKRERVQAEAGKGVWMSHSRDDFEILLLCLHNSLGWEYMCEDALVAIRGCAFELARLYITAKKFDIVDVQKLVLEEFSRITDPLDLVRSAELVHSARCADTSFCDVFKTTFRACYLSDLTDERKERLREDVRNNLATGDHMLGSDIMDALLDGPITKAKERVKPSTKDWDAKQPLLDWPKPSNIGVRDDVLDEDWAASAQEDE